MPYAFRGTDDESQYPDFYQASWIKEIILGKYIKTILDNAFKRCGDYNGTNNVNVILNDGLKYLSNGSFGYCRINKLSLPSSVKAIQSPFMFCYNLIVNSNIVTFNNDTNSPSSSVATKSLYGGCDTVIF